MACVRMDMSDPTARSLCFGCGATWTLETEAPCPDCGTALVSRERVIREFEGSVRDRDASLPELSSLDLLCTTTIEDEQRHVRSRLAEYDVAHFCFSEEQRRAGDGPPATATSFYIAELHLEWARDRLADFFRGGSSVLLARAVDDVEALTYRAALEDRGFGYTTSRLTGQYPIEIGPETLFFVAEVDAEAARRAIEEAGNAGASTTSAQDVAGEAIPGAPSADATGTGQEESSASSTAESVVSADESRPLPDLRDERRYMITRLLLYLSATTNFLLGAVSLWTSVPIPGAFLGAVTLGIPVPIGVFCLSYGAVLALLGLWSRRNPEHAFGWSLALLILYQIGGLAALGRFSLLGLFPFPFITILATLFSWRRARERRLEGSRDGTSSSAGLQDS